jgi:hypothetical protein
MSIGKAKNVIYVPRANYYGVGVYDYPSGTFVTTIRIHGFPAGAAFRPAPTR